MSGSPLTTVVKTHLTPSTAVLARHGQNACPQYGSMVVQRPQHSVHRPRSHPSLTMTARRLTTAAAQAETTNTESLPALQPLDGMLFVGSEVVVLRRAPLLQPTITPLAHRHV